MKKPRPESPTRKASPRAAESAPAGGASVGSQYAEAILRAVPLPFLVLRADLRVDTVSEAFYKVFQVTPEATEGRFVYEIGNGQWNIPELRELLEEIIPKDKVFTGFEMTHEFADIGTRTMLLDARRVEKAGVPELILVAIEDITERRQAEAALRASTAQMRFVTDHVAVFIVRCDAQQRYTFVNAPYAARFGLRPEDIVDRTIVEVVGEPAYVSFRRHVEAALRGERVEFEERIPYQHGARWMHCVYVPDRAPDDEVSGFVAVIQDVTARKEAEDRLRESREHVENIVESITDAFVTLDREWRFTHLNDRALEIIRPLRRSREDLLGKNHWEEFPELRGTVVEENYRRAVAEQVTVEFEVYFAPLDAWMEVRVYPFKDGVSIYFQDVSVRKRAVDALQASESLKSSILTCALDAIIMMDHEGKVVDFNPAAEYTFGYSREEIVGQTMAEKIIPERLRAAHYAGLERYLASGEARVLGRRIEVPALHADGHEFFIEISINRIAGVEPALFTATLRDITERQRAEDALRKSEERFRGAMNNMAEGLFTVDAQGLVTYINPAAEEMFGWSSAELLGKKMHDVTHYKHPDGSPFPTCDCAGLQVLKLGLELREYEDVFIRNDGSFFPVVFSAAPLIAGDETIGVVVAFRDDTTRRRNEEALRAAMAEIEAALRAKDDFLAALSHELRTPLTPVLMTVSALESDPALPAEAREQLAMMRRNIELEARLIDDLLDITRISRGKLNIAPAATDIHQLLGHTEEIVRSDGLGKQVRVSFLLEAARHHALADATRLQQVFWNLVKNALKFTPAGGSITVRTRNDDEGWIVVTVEDTGVGISAEALPHIFKAFEQGDIAGQHRYGGLGLGLAISQAIVDVHGGAIHADSKGPGQGSLFTVVLASVDAPSNPAGYLAQPAAAARARRLLVVEDHEATRTVLTRLLTRNGHHVTSVATIHEALAVFAVQQFDGVISDLGLPDGSGLDLMREFQRQRPIPGIALSGYGMEDDLRQTKEAGFFAHLVKPVNIDQLRRLLDQM